MSTEWRNANMNKEEQIEQIENTLMRLKEYGVTEDVIVKRYENKILSLKNVVLSYFFAKNVDGADVIAHGKVIIESKDPAWNYFFASEIKGADIKAHEKAVIESKDPEWNCKFVNAVEGADIKAHGKVVIESKDSDFNDWFKKNFEDEYEIIKRNYLIKGAYNFIDNALDEMIEENKEENKSMQKRF